MTAGGGKEKRSLPGIPTLVRIKQTMFASSSPSIFRRLAAQALLRRSGKPRYSFPGETPGSVRIHLGGRELSVSLTRTFSSGAGGAPRSPVSWGGMLLCFTIGAGVVGYYNYEKERRLTQVQSTKVTTIGEASIGGPWTLVGTNGKIATDKDLLGKFVLVYFGFTHCPDICPNELVKIGTIMDSLESNQSTKGKVEPVFISIDPRRDTVGQMERYRHDFHPKIRYLTGTPDQVTRVAKLFRVYWSKVDEVVDDDDEEDYSVDHTIVLYLMGPDGKFIDLFTQSVETKAILSKINDIVSNHQEA